MASVYVNTRSENGHGSPREQAAGRINQCRHSPLRRLSFLLLPHLGSELPLQGLVIHVVVMLNDLAVLDAEDRNALRLQAG